MRLADEVKVALVTAACVLGIAVIFKNILHVQADFIASNGPFYLFVFYLITRGRAKKSGRDNPLYWSLAIVAVTVLTVVLYAA